MPVAGSRLALLPFLPFDWLRQHAGAAFGGGAAAPALRSLRCGALPP